MRAKIFQPFQKVWTPRTPDWGYDSYGEGLIPSPIVATAVTETLNASLTLVSGTYTAATAITGARETMGASIKPASGTYTP